jgi:RNA polymerase sigma-70 factor (ECF subfamily)
VPLNELRNSAHANSPGDAIAAAGNTTAQSVERRLHVLEAMQLLSEPHRQILSLREIQGLSYEELSTVLGVPRGTIESRLFRARREFRERFGPIDDLK